MPATPISLLESLRRRNAGPDWDRFVTLYTPLLFHWARRFGLSHDDSADLVQDVFAILARELPGFDYDSAKRFRGWLWTVTLNKVRERKRALAARPRTKSLHDLPDPPAEDPAPEVDAEEYRAYLTQRALKLMQAEFSSTIWQACWKTTVEGLSASEVARQLGMTVNAVYVAKSRVLRRLREVLRGLLD